MRSQVTKTNDVGTGANRLVKHLPDLLRNLSEKDDEQLVEIVISAHRLERFAFLVRGTCGSLLRQRHQRRLSGGRGKRDLLGRGIRAHLDRIARQAGVDRKTLETDTRIKDIFFPTIGETILADIPSLGREYFVTALSAPDPHDAIRMAVERCAERDYRLKQFRADVRTLKQNGAPSVARAIPDTTCTLSIRLPTDVRQLVTELMSARKNTKDEVVADAIRAFHTSVARSLKRRTKAARAVKSDAGDLNSKQLELEM